MDFGGKKFFVINIKKEKEEKKKSRKEKKWVLIKSVRLKSQKTSEEGKRHKRTEKNQKGKHNVTKKKHRAPQRK